MGCPQERRKGPSEGRRRPKGPQAGAPPETGIHAPQRLTQTATRPVDPDQSAGPDADDPEETARWWSWLQRTQDEHETTLSEDLALRALRLFRAATGGLRWKSHSGGVGIGLYKRLRAIHKNMLDPEPLNNPRLHDFITSGDVIRFLDFVNPNVIPEIGQNFTTHDVNKQFNAAAGSARLGTGDPTWYGHIWELGPTFLKSPGYARIAHDLDTNHPAFQDIRKGAILVMPHIAYLMSRGVRIEVAEAAIWDYTKTGSGNHLSAWSGHFRRAFDTLRDHPDPDAAHLADYAVKKVVTVFLGGLMRSEQHNQTSTLRYDWSDHVITHAGANMLRSLDKATYGLPHDTKDPDVAALIRAGTHDPVIQPLGIWRDAVWHIHDHPAPRTPTGLHISTQQGKWKVEKWGEVTPELIEAHQDGSAHGMAAVIKHIDQQRRSESEQDGHQ